MFPEIRPKVFIAHLLGETVRGKEISFFYRRLKFLLSNKVRHPIMTSTPYNGTTKRL